jgi:hypothetical protein
MTGIRSMIGHSGVCDVCSRFEHVWITSDGQGNGLPGPQLCDDCNTRRTVREWFVTDPAFAQRIYCARNAEDALRMMEVDPFAR